jgi:hypothetical protein
MSQKDIRDLLHPMRLFTPGDARGVVGKLEFPLPEENDAFLIAVRAPILHRTLREVDEELRSLLKHDNPSGKTAEELAEWLRSKIAGALYPHD